MTDQESNEETSSAVKSGLSLPFEKQNKTCNLCKAAVNCYRNNTNVSYHLLGLVWHRISSSLLTLLVLYLLTHLTTYLATAPLAMTVYLQEVFSFWKFWEMIIDAGASILNTKLLVFQGQAEKEMYKDTKIMWIGHAIKISCHYWQELFNKPYPHI